MHTIYKYTLSKNCTNLVMPTGAKILSVQQQGTRIVFWAMIDPAMPPVTRTFRVLETGEYFEVEGVLYIGTVQEGLYVWHIFEQL